MKIFNLAGWKDCVLEALRSLLADKKPENWLHAVLRLAYLTALIMFDSSMILAIGAVALFGVTGYLILRRRLAAPGRAVEGWIRQIEAGEKPSFSVKQDFGLDLVLTADGFEIVPLKRKKDQAVRVEWQRVLEVHGYKRDLITTDLVCIGFSLENDTTVEIHEEMRGFTALCEELPSALPGVLPSERWYQDIAFGPAETKMARLFVRAPGSLSA